MNIRGFFVPARCAPSPGKNSPAEGVLTSEIVLMVQLRAIPLHLAPPRNGVTTAI